MQQGVHEFESTLRRLQSDGPSSDDAAADTMRVEVGAAEHLMKLEAMLPSAASMDAEAQQYLGTSAGCASSGKRRRLVARSVRCLRPER